MFSGRFGVQRKTGPVEARRAGTNCNYLLYRYSSAWLTKLNQSLRLPLIKTSERIRMESAKKESHREPRVSRQFPNNPLDSCATPATIVDSTDQKRKALRLRNRAYSWSDESNSFCSLYIFLYSSWSYTFSFSFMRINVFSESKKPPTVKNPANKLPLKCFS